MSIKSQKHLLFVKNNTLYELVMLNVTTLVY
jgi:hypothetical protein